MLDLVGRHDGLDSNDVISSWLETRALRRPPRPGDRTRSPHTYTRFTTATVLLLRCSIATYPRLYHLLGRPWLLFFVLMNVYPALYDM